MAKKPAVDKDAEPAAAEAEANAPAPVPRDDAASDRIAVPCLVTITDRVRPVGAKRLSLVDARKNTHWFTRGGKAAEATNRMILPPPAQRDLRARGWAVVNAVKE